jgi:type IV pilus assembly protein PilE
VNESRPENLRGFTLIELLVTIAILSILASIAIPMYSGYITRGRIPVATNALSDVRVQMEQYFQDNRRYATVSGGTACGVTMPTALSNFSLSCAVTANTNNYLITATGSGPMASFVYNINEAGVRRTTGLPSGWSGASATSTCWVLTKSGSC